MTSALFLGCISRSGIAECKVAMCSALAETAKWFAKCSILPHQQCLRLPTELNLYMWTHVAVWDGGRWRVELGRKTFWVKRNAMMPRTTVKTCPSGLLHWGHTSHSGSQWPGHSSNRPLWLKVSWPAQCNSQNWTIAWSSLLPSQESDLHQGLSMKKRWKFSFSKDRFGLGLTF